MDIWVVSTFWLFWIMKLKSESESCSVMSDALQPCELSGPLTSPGQNTGVGSLFLLQGIFPTQEQNPGLPHCRQILYQLSHQGSPRILEWIPIPSLGDLPDPGVELESPLLQANSLPTVLLGKPKKVYSTLYSQAVSHPNTNQTWPCFTFKIRQDRVNSGWNGSNLELVIW